MGFVQYITVQANNLNVRIREDMGGAHSYGRQRDAQAALAALQADHITPTADYDYYPEPEVGYVIDSPVGRVYAAVTANPTGDGDIEAVVSTAAPLTAKYDGQPSDGVVASVRLFATLRGGNGWHVEGGHGLWSDRDAEYNLRRLLPFIFEQAVSQHGNDALRDMVYNAGLHKEIQQLDRKLAKLRARRDDLYRKYRITK